METNNSLVQQRQNMFKTMSVEPTRKSKEDKMIAGTIAIHNDNIDKLNIINKLQCFLESLKSHPMNENDVHSMIVMCKEHLQQSHDVANINLPLNGIN